MHIFKFCTFSSISADLAGDIQNKNVYIRLETDLVYVVSNVGKYSTCILKGLYLYKIKKSDNSLYDKKCNDLDDLDMIKKHFLISSVNV